MKDKAIALPCLEGERDLVTTALDGILGEIVAEVLRATESGHVLFPCCGERRRKTNGVGDSVFSGSRENDRFNSNLKI